MFVGTDGKAGPFPDNTQESLNAFFRPHPARVSQLVSGAQMSRAF